MAEKKKDKTYLYCECCGDKFKRWFMDMVIPDIHLFEIADLMESRGELIEFNYACPICIEKYELEPLQSEKAKRFRESNQILQDTLEPVLVH